MFLSPSQLPDHTESHPASYPITTHGTFLGERITLRFHLVPSLGKCGASNPTYSLQSVTETFSPVRNYGFRVRFDWFRTESSGGIV
jgi:hypothetical protein